MYSRPLVIIALSTLSAAAMANTFINEGSMQPVPQAVHPDAANREEVQAQASTSLPLNRDTIVAEGLRSGSTPALTMSSRDAVRAEALQANRSAYHANAQVNEGV